MTLLVFLSTFSINDCFAQRAKPAVVIHGLNVADTTISVQQLKKAGRLDLVNLPDYTITNHDLIVATGENNILSAGNKSAEFHEMVLEYFRENEINGQMVWVENIVATSSKGQIMTFPNQRIHLTH